MYFIGWFGGPLLFVEQFGHRGCASDIKMWLSEPSSVISGSDVMYGILFEIDVSR